MKKSQVILCLLFGFACLQLRLDAAHLRGEKPRLDQLASGEWLLDARNDKPLILDPQSGKVVAPPDRIK